MHSVCARPLAPGKLARSVRPALHTSAALWLCLLAMDAHANPQDIEEGEPVTLEDAFTDPPGQLSVQYSGTYTRLQTGTGHDVFESGPTFKLGATRSVQVSLNPNYESGTSSQRNSGFVLSDVLVQFNTQTALIPALAADMFYSLPFGAGRKSSAYVVRVIASKSLGGSESAPRLHINLTDFHTIQPDIGGRRDQLQIVLGGSVQLSQRDALVADIVHGAAEDVGRRETFVEIGYSRDLPDDWTCQLGIARQVNGAPYATRIFFAIEKELQIY